VVGTALGTTKNNNNKKKGMGSATGAMYRAKGVGAEDVSLLNG